ncbi:MAG: hypothetical protein IBX61_02715 [Thermoleophilia bacterium]|nr:hypothetical protein [Thermoleophilia bacterium]
MAVRDGCKELATMMAMAGDTPVQPVIQRLSGMVPVRNSNSELSIT